MLFIFFIFVWNLGYFLMLLKGTCVPLIRKKKTIKAVFKKSNYRTHVAWGHA